tara:strand:+ start:10346 stop:11212 length:867 start_codon:yes stop_codon:yes gene_type:complete
MLNINDNLNNFKNGQSYRYLEDKFNILESLYLVNPRISFETFIDQNNPEIIDYLNLINFSYFDNYSVISDRNFSENLKLYIENNFILFNHNFTSENVLTELKIMWTVLMSCNFLNSPSDKMKKNLLKMFNHFVETKSINLITPALNFKPYHIAELLSDFDNDYLFIKTLKLYVNDILNNYDKALPGIKFEFDINFNTITRVNKHPQLIHFLWNDFVSSITNNTNYRLCKNCNDLFSTKSDRKIFCNYICKNRKSSSDAYNRYKKRNFIQLTSKPGLTNNAKPYKIITK